MVNFLIRTNLKETGKHALFSIDKLRKLVMDGDVYGLARGWRKNLVTVGVLNKKKYYNLPYWNLTYGSNLSE